MTLLQEMFTPSEVAKHLRMKGDKVRAFIASGELSAIDVSKSGSKKRRYLVPREAYERFLAARAVAKSGAPTVSRITVRRVSSKSKEPRRVF